MEPPSQQLLQTLQALDLCTPRDLRRCRGLVRRLTRDLPAFDSVWIDALLQTGKLTPFQARLLENHQGDRLNVGPCLLIHQLGHGIDSATYLARPRDGRQRSVLKIIRRPPEVRDHVLTALQQLAIRMQGLTHPVIVGPHRCLQHNDQLVTISRHVPGLHLGELVVRRGRFPAWTVREIARQLIDGLAALEAKDCVHGDVCLWNVRLTSGGVAVLVDAGIRPAVSPDLSFHADLPPERFDGIAPERIGTGAPATSVSDLYAVGCLLWHLLAGRPPFPTGDPLAKLAAHQTRELDDVREWAPDTPADLAEAIRRFTASDPNSRPQSFQEARDEWGSPRRAGTAGHRRLGVRVIRRNVNRWPSVPGRRRLAKFRAAFETDARRIPATGPPATSVRWSWLLVLLLVLSGAAFTMLHQGARSFVLRIPHRLGRPWSPIAGTWFSTDQRSETIDQTPVQSPLPLPKPNADHVIELASPGPFAASDLAAVGPLTIRGTADRPSEIVVTDQPLHVWAKTLTLENVSLRWDSGASLRSSPGDPETEPVVLLIAESQNLTMRGCRFQLDEGRGTRDEGPFPISQRSTLNAQPASVTWKGIDEADETGGGILIGDTVFVGAGSGILFHTPPEHVRTDNCLKLGSGALFTLAVAPPAERELRIELSRVTLRQAETLLRLQLHPVMRGSADAAGLRTDVGRIAIEAGDCVWDLHGRGAALFQVVSEHSPDEMGPGMIHMTGAGSLANSDLIVGTWLNPATGEALPLGPGFAAVEGIAAGEFEFAGTLGPHPDDSAVTSWRAPRRSSNPPGIDPTTLPASQR